jgi:hypothetical protein
MQRRSSDKSIVSRAGCFDDFVQVAQGNRCHRGATTWTNVLSASGEWAIIGPGPVLHIWPGVTLPSAVAGLLDIMDGSSWGGVY